MKIGFPLFITGIFVFFLVIAVLLFSGLLPTPKSSKVSKEIQGTVTIWGTFPARGFNQIVQQFYPPNKVTYVQKDGSTFNHDLLQALAAGQGPDLVLLPQDLIIKWQKSLLHIPYSVITERQYRNTYLGQASLYLRSDGILALPFYIDPMVMYWNQDLFAQQGIVEPPKYWSQFYDLVPKLTKRAPNGNVLQSAVALGQYSNIDHAKDILSMMMLQLGNPIIEIGPSGPYSTIAGDRQLGIPSGNQAFAFYTNFSDPAQQDIYTWNRALPDSESMFINQKLAIYFGYASEYFDLRQKNPLLNFDVTEVPQVKGAKFSATIGKIYGVAILKQSKNIQSAYRVALTLAGPDFSQELSKSTFLPPVQRALYATRPTDAFRTVFYDSAIISRGWQDPDPDKTSQMFQNAVGDITSGASSVQNAVGELNKEVKALLKQVVPEKAPVGAALPGASL